MSLLRRTAALAGVVGLVACSAFAPFSTEPASPDPGATDAGPRVAICYNTLRTDLQKVQEEAQAECGANTVAQPVETDWHLVHCPLLLPARGTFVCAPKK